MNPNFPEQTAPQTTADADFYCANCRVPAAEPLRCGDCGSLICRRCGSPLERTDDLGIG